MKRALLLSLVLLLSSISGSLFAIDNKYEDYFSFRITPQFEIANGIINEYVFDDACENTGNKLSELNWHLSSLAIFNLQADFDIIKYLSVGLSASFAVPQRSDFMQDSDWQNSTTTKYPEWRDDDPTERTDFSEHINDLDKYISFTVSAGGNLYLPFKITLTPYVAYQYEFIKFLGHDGYGIYKQNNFQPSNYSGKVISYEQELNSVLFGLRTRINCIPRTRINLNFNLSPKMTNISAIDYHFTTGFAYNDRIKNLLAINSDLSAQYSFTKNHSAGFAGKIQYIPLSKGDTYQGRIDSEGELTSDDWKQIGTDTGGTDRFIWSLSLNYSFSL